MISGDTSPQDENAHKGSIGGYPHCGVDFRPAQPRRRHRRAQWLVVTCLGFAGQHCLGGWPLLRTFVSIDAKTGVSADVLITTSAAAALPSTLNLSVCGRDLALWQYEGNSSGLKWPPRR